MLPIGTCLTHHFSSDATANVNTIKDMLAGLSEFQEGKNSYTLHLNMAQEAMKIFQERNLAELASLEQVSPLVAYLYCNHLTKILIIVNGNTARRGL